MEMESCVPPGFRFHPTEEELVDYYLKRKINDLKIDLDVIIDIDLYKIEPWDIQERCKLGYDEQNEWYFFSHKDKKYPTGTRTNRATGAGFWKATGRDKAVVSKNRIIGMRKTLVFYKGRAPNGRKTDWIMHEYRHQTSHHAPPQEEGWVVCRAFRKPSPSQTHQIRPAFEAWNDNHNHNHNHNNNYPYYVTENTHNYSRPPNFPADFIVDQKNNNNNNNIMVPNNSNLHNCFVSAQEMVSNNQSFADNINRHHEVLPQLDSPSSVSASFAANESFQNSNGIMNGDFDHGEIRSGQYIDDDWKNLDSLLMASHLTDNNNNNNLLSPSSIPHSSDIYDQRQITQSQQHYHGCFPDL